MRGQEFDFPARCFSKVWYCLHFGKTNLCHVELSCVAQKISILAPLCPLHLTPIKCRWHFTATRTVGKAIHIPKFFPLVADPPTQDHWALLWGRIKSGFRGRVIQELPRGRVWQKIQRQIRSPKEGKKWCQMEQKDQRVRTPPKTKKQLGKCFSPHLSLFQNS